MARERLDRDRARRMVLLEARTRVQGRQDDAEILGLHQGIGVAVALTVAALHAQLCGLRREIEGQLNPGQMLRGPLGTPTRLTGGCPLPVWNSVMLDPPRT